MRIIFRQNFLAAPARAFRSIYTHYIDVYIGTSGVMIAGDWEGRLGLFAICLIISYLHRDFVILFQQLFEFYPFLHIVRVDKTHSD